jgi:hypothetical protein
LRQINLGDNNPRRRQERKEVVPNKPKTKQVYCVELDKVFESAKSAAIQLGLSDSNIAKCCKGKYKTTGGYHWKYADNLVKEMVGEDK